jgi:hypothetical protein
VGCQNDDGNETEPCLNAVQYLTNEVCWSVAQRLLRLFAQRVTSFDLLWMMATLDGHPGTILSIKHLVKAINENRQSDNFFKPFVCTSVAQASH